MDLYREEVMDHYEHPRNQGELVGDDVIYDHEVNASCGDSVQFYLKLEGKSEKGKVIVDVKWSGVGCAITTASPVLSEYLQGQDLKVLKSMSEDELVKKGIGFEVNPGRIKCLMLPIKVVKKILSF
jgi:nitrogen fixation NifU-like protein